MNPLDRETVEILTQQERARELNEQGCFAIEVGYYDRAIALLTEALNAVETMKSRSCSRHLSITCGLDVCLEYTQNYSNLVNYGVQNLTSPSSTEKTNPFHVARSEDATMSTSSGFIYKQPFRIPYHAVAEGFCLGQTLPLVVVFNLALAYHLNAILCKKSGGNLTSSGRAHLENILQLYEMAYQWHMEQERVQPLSPSSGLSSLKFIMILANNLAQIHLAVQSMTKYRLCLQHLLSTMMFMVDGLQCSPQARPATDALFPPPELDGFLRNVSCLFLRDQAAAAA